MKKILFIPLFFSLTVQGQIAAIFSDIFQDSAKVRLGITAEYELNSSAFTNQFILKFYRGEYINADLKNNVLDRIRNSNRVGADVNYGIYGAFKLDSLFHNKNTSIFFTLRDRQHFDGRFSKDFYKVGFYGNAQFAGNTANMNDFNIKLIRYQQVQIGFFLTNLDSAARFGMGISFLKGEQYASVLAKKAELYTSKDGQYIDFNTSLEVMQSDTSRKGIGTFNGYGASADLYFEAPFKTRLGASKLCISIADVGLIRFNDQSLVLKQDSLFHYTGFSISNIYDLQDSTFKKASQDSIINAIAPFQKKSFSVTIPSTLNLSFQTQFSKRFRLTEGIRYVFNANYSLLMYLKAYIYINPKLMISSTFGYGGYGHFNYGLGMFAQLGKGFVVYAGSNNIEGYILPKVTTGQGAYVSLIKNFK